MLLKQVIVCSDVSYFRIMLGSGMRPTTKFAEGGAERQDSVTTGLRQMDCHFSNNVGRLGNEQDAKHKEVHQAVAVTAVASNKKALECQSSDSLAKINSLTKCIALLVEGMTRERFLLRLRERRNERRFDCAREGDRRGGKATSLRPPLWRDKHATIEHGRKSKRRDSTEMKPHTWSARQEFYEFFQQSGTCWSSSEDNTRRVQAL